MPTVKRPITLRIDPELLQQVRLSAARDNRTVTNYIETALRRHLDPDAQNDFGPETLTRRSVQGRR